MAKKVNYKKAGVDIAKANAFVSAIKRDVKGTFVSGVLQRSGSFGALFELAKTKYRQPVLVSSTDGVGTKLLIAQAAGKHDTVGIDLVAMNVNDILCTGAKPLFFLDYLACGKVNVKVLRSVMKGVAKGCRQSGCALIGGETAEMPGMYASDEYDLAGFAVGVAEKSKLIDGRKIVPGDVVIGLPSSGLHSNGFSLVRKVFSRAEQKKRAAELLAPTRIYAKEVQLLTEKFNVKGIAHVTGGAFYEKVTKILPKGKGFVIDGRSWPVPEIFQNIQKRGKITHREMHRTFNMGIGLVVVLAKKDAARAQALLKKKRIKSYEIGKVVNSSKEKMKLV